MSPADLEPAESATLPFPAPLFPLRFTPFERLKLLDDRPDYPMTILVHVELGGRIRRTQFENAVAETIKGHPFLTARAEIRRSWPWWIAAEDLKTWSFQWHETEIGTQAPRHSKLDVLAGNNVAASIYAGENRSVIRLEFHHACTDGQGVRRFTYDLLSHYERLTLGDASQRSSARFDALLQERLLGRQELAPAAETEISGEKNTTLGERLQNTLSFFTKRPTPLAVPQKPEWRSRSGGAGAGDCHWTLLDEAETRSIRTRSVESNATFNDVAVAMLMRVLADWNREFGSCSDRSRVRIVMPTDLRSKEDHLTPAANRMGYAFPSRTCMETRDWPALLKSVHAETTYIKERRLGADFVANITMAQAVPGLLPLFLRYSGCLATAALTNLGDVTRRFRRRFPKNGAGQMLVGGLPLLASHVTPPPRPGTRAGFGMCVSSDRLSISLVTDPLLFDNALTAELLRRYVTGIRSWIRAEI